MSQQAAQAAGMFAPTGKSGENAKAIGYLLIVGVVVVIIIIAIKQGSKIFGDISGGIDKFLVVLGLKDSAAKQKANEDLAKADQIANQVTSPFNPTFYKSAPAGTPLFTSSDAAALAEQIYDSVGILYDDPESGYGAFKQASSWAKVSQISDVFNRLFGKDVYSWMKIKYDTTTQKDVLSKIVNYAAALPKY